MNTYDRRNKIIDLVNQNGTVMVAELSSSFDVSEVTIRSDLGLLEQKGALKRFHGGAAKRDASVANLTGLPQDEMVLEERYLQASDPKKTYRSGGGRIGKNPEIPSFSTVAVPPCCWRKNW